MAAQFVCGRHSHTQMWGDWVLIIVKSVSAVTNVYSCVACSQNKHRNQAPAGLLQPLPIPSDRWEVWSMDQCEDCVKGKPHRACWKSLNSLLKVLVSCILDWYHHMVLTVKSIWNGPCRNLSELSEFGIIGIRNCRNSELSECGIVGIRNCRNSELSEFGIVGTCLCMKSIHVCVCSCLHFVCSFFIIPIHTTCSILIVLSLSRISLCSLPYIRLLNSTILLQNAQLHWGVG